MNDRLLNERGVTTTQATVDGGGVMMEWGGSAVGARASLRDKVVMMTVIALGIVKRASERVKRSASNPGAEGGGCRCCC